MSAKRVLVLLAVLGWPRLGAAQSGAPLPLVPGPTAPEAGRKTAVPGGAVYASGDLLLSFSLPSWTTASGLRAAVNLHYNSAAALDCASDPSAQQGFGCGVSGPGGRLTLNGDGTVTIRESDLEARNFTVSGSNYVRAASEASRFDYNVLVPTRVNSVIVSFTEQAHDGRWRTFSDLDHDGVTFVESAFGNRTVDYVQYGYSSDERRLTSIGDASGRHVTLVSTVQSGATLITAITGAEGEAIALTYAQNGDGRLDLSSIQLPGFVAGTPDTTSLQVDGSHLLQTLTTSPEGAATYTYDGDGRLTSATDRMGLPLVFAYYSDQFSITDAYFEETTFKYLDGLLVKEIAPDGLATEYVYDASNRLLETTDALGDTTRFTYTNGDLTQLVNVALNRTTTSTYNGKHDLLTSHDYLGNTTTITRDSFGQPLTMVDPSGVTTTVVYDATGNPTQITTDGRTQTRTNNSYGQPVAVTNFDGRRTAYGYDGWGNLATVTLPCPDGTIIRTSTPTGLILSVKDPSGVTTQYTYNDAHQVTSVTNSLGQSVTTNYGADGNPTEVNDRGDDWTGQWDPMTGLLASSQENGVGIQDSGAMIPSQPLPVGAACSTDCATFCGSLTLCGQSVDCGACGGGKVCSALNQCVTQ